MNKKISVLLTALLVVTMAVPVFAAESKVDEGAKVEITGGKVEFSFDIFNSDSATDVDNGSKKVDTSDSDILGVNKGSSELTIEITAKILENFDWTLTAGDEDFGLNLKRDFADGFVELSSDVNAQSNATLWGDLTDDLAVTANKSVGKVEAQAKANPNDGVIEDGSTYLKYNFNDNLSTTLRTYEVEFIVGDKFETDLTTGNPGIEVSYTKEDITLDGALTTIGNSRKNTDNENTSSSTTDGYEYSDRTIKLKTAGTYDLGDTGSTSVAVLLHSDSNSTVEKKGDKSKNVTELDLVLNGDATYNIDALTIDGELSMRFNNNKEKDNNLNNPKTKDESLTELGLYAKATYDFDVATVYGSYKLDTATTKYKEAADGEKEEETTTTNTITLGADKKLEDGIILNAEFFVVPTTDETSIKGGNTTTSDSTSTSLTTTVTYEF